jgi:putative DNA primase/helicase
MKLLDDFAWTDSGNAERVVALYGRDLRFVRTWGKWIVWDDREGRWAPDEGGVFRAAKATARAMQAEAARIDDYQQRQAATRFALKSESKAGITAMVTLARNETAVAITHAELDAHRMLFNCGSGAIDLRSGALRPHKREDLLTKRTKVAFDAAATCPAWDAFVLRIMGGDATMVDYLQRLAGYALTGEIREHVLAFFFGKGANGKSTFLRTMHEVLGDYATPAPRGLLFRRQGERHETEYASLHGRRFVTCSEIEEGQAFDEALVKDLTGGDPIMCRRMREDHWHFDPTHKLFIAGNHKPSVRGDDEGIWRRMRLIPFLITFAANEQDKKLGEKLLDEAPGILAWAVRGCLAWQERGLAEPETVRRATSDYREESDALGEFLRLNVVFEAGVSVARKDIRESYEAFSKENGAQPLGAKRFAARLREHGVTPTARRVGPKVVDAWRGVRLATDAERAAATVWSERMGVGPSSGQDPVCLTRDSQISRTADLALQDPTPIQAEPTFGDWLAEQGIEAGR